MRDQSNINKAIKFAITKGFEEYKVNALENYDKAFQKKISEHEFINVNCYCDRMLPVHMQYGIEIVHYRDHKLYAQKDLYYCFNDLNAFKKIINKLLKP